MKTLILGAIPDDFSPQKHIPIGAFCFIEREHIYPGWEKLSFEPDPFPTPEDLKKADQMTIAYTNKIFYEIGDQLNDRLDLSYSAKFWKIAIFYYLATLIQTTWEKQVRIENIVKRYEDQKIRVELVKDNIEWKFKELSDYFTNGIEDVLYNEWLFSRMIENINPERWSIEYIDKYSIIKQREKKPRNVNNQSILFRMKKTIHLVLHNVLSRYYGINGFNYFDAFLINILLSLKRGKKGDLCDLTEDRNMKSQLLMTNDLRWIYDIRKLIWNTMPKAIEDIPHHIKNQNRRFKSGKFNIGSMGLWNTDLRNLRLALAVENDENLISAQHGGHVYGSGKTCGSLNEFEYKQYIHITWGWETQEDYEGNFYPLPSPYLQKISNRHKEKNQKLIFLPTLTRLLMLRLWAQPQTYQFLRMRLDQVDFFKEVDDEIFKTVYCRPYFDHPVAQKDTEYLLKVFPNMQIIRKDLRKEILNCRLIVMDNPGTSLNIALAANTPILFYWDTCSWPFSRQASIFIDKFKELGIFFENGKMAAQKVNEIWDYVNEWWEQPQIQEVRDEWIWSYARTSRLWRWEWVKFLWNL